MTRVLPLFFEFDDVPGDWPAPPAFRSRREILARSRGLRIFRGIGIRRSGLSRDDAIDLAESLPPPTFRSRGAWIDLDAIEEGRAGETNRRRRRIRPNSIGVRTTDHASRGKTSPL
jgi:tRNA (guanine-N7-)-methyltransferase